MTQIHDLSSSRVVQQIEILYQAKRSGTIFLMTEKNIMVQIMLADGNIIAVHYLTQRGIDALKRIFESASFVLFDFKSRDKSAAEPKADSELPSMPEILRIIKNPGAVAASSGNGVDLSQANKIIITELTLYLGPMAAIVCKGHLAHAQNLNSIMSSLDIIASEIGDAATERKFKQQVTAKIQAL